MKLTSKEIAALKRASELEGFMRSGKRWYPNIALPSISQIDPDFGISQTSILKLIQMGYVTDHDEPWEGLAEVTKEGHQAVVRGWIFD